MPKLLDTSVVVNMLREAYAQGVRPKGFEDDRICWITEGEVLLGAKRSIRPRLAETREFIASFFPIYPDAVTSEFYSDIEAALRSAGTPIPQNDVWTAACAIQHDLVLVTQDDHYSKVPGLKLEPWRLGRHRPS